MRKSITCMFQDMTRLYHFTNYESARLIIKSRKLRFGQSCSLNDLIESNKVIWERVLSEELVEDCNGQFAEQEMHRYQQLSFSQDKEYDGRDYLGFDLHTMWGLYADKGYGVCLVFDKDKLILGPNDYANNVHYYDIIPQCFAFNNRSKSGIKSEVWRKKDEIFFNKRKEWEYEQEYRVIRRAGKINAYEYLDISDSLSFVIVCKDCSVNGLESMFNSDIYNELHCLDKNLPILTYEYGLDGYTLFENYMVPIWAEQLGYL